MRFLTLYVFEPLSYMHYQYVHDYYFSQYGMLELYTFLQNSELTVKNLQNNRDGASLTAIVPHARNIEYF